VEEDAVLLLLLLLLLPPPRFRFSQYLPATWCRMSLEQRRRI
jgi:hypothetical protein